MLYLTTLGGLTALRSLAGVLQGFFFAHLHNNNNKNFNLKFSDIARFITRSGPYVAAYIIDERRKTLSQKFWS